MLGPQLMRSILTLTLAVVALTSTTLGQTTVPKFNPGAAAGTVANTSLTEISGIAASRQNNAVVWDHNDSGDLNRLYAMSTNGAHLGTFFLAGAVATDWEDMAIGPGPIPGQDYLFVADTGNNDLSRNTATIYRVAEPSLVGAQFPVETTLSGVQAFPVRFPDQNRDVETLLVDPQTGDIVLLTRDRTLTGTTHIYLYPVEDQAPGVLVTLIYVGAIASNIEIKGGGVSPDGQWILLRRHSKTESVDGWMYYRAPGTPIESSFAVAPGLVPLVFEPQGEAVTFTPDSTGYYTISEGVAQPIYFYGPLTPPAAPSNGSATATSDTQIRLSWNDNANNETQYLVERSTDNLNYGQPVILPANATGYTDSGLTASTPYWYRITARNDAGNSGPLILTTTTTAPPPPPPSAPSGLTATAVSKSQINLKWTDTSSNEDGYKIERSADGLKYTQIAIVSANTTSYANTRLTANKLYYYRVRAYNGSGHSGYSNVASARTPR